VKLSYYRIMRRMKLTALVALVAVATTTQSCSAFRPGASTSSSSRRPASSRSMAGAVEPVALEPEPAGGTELTALVSAGESTRMKQLDEPVDAKIKGEDGLTPHKFWMTATAEVRVAGSVRGGWLDTHETSWIDRQEAQASILHPHESSPQAGRV